MANEALGTGAELAARMAARLRAGLALLLLALLGTAAWGQAAAPRFDHDSTGFALTGKHEDVRCETCHQRGIFKGTPRDCATCHAQNNSRGATAMPVRHVQTTQSCDACHGTSSFAGAIFSHVAVAPSSCNSCHDGLRATGKPNGHPATTASCDLCHVTGSFAGQARKPTNHIPYAASATCTSCHVGGFTVSPTLSAIHANAPSTTNNCAQCHGAAAASFAIPAKGFTVEWFGSYAQAQRDDPSIRDMVYQPDPSANDWRLSGQGASVMFLNLKDHTGSGAADFTLPFKQWRQLDGKAKIGVWMEGKDRTFTVRRFTFQTVNGIVQDVGPCPTCGGAGAMTPLRDGAPLPNQ